MGIYLISYDLQDPTKENDLLAYLKNATMTTKSAYLLSTTMTPQALVDAIKAIANNKVTVYVFTITSPYGGYGPKDANDWLARSLP